MTAYLYVPIIHVLFHIFTYLHFCNLKEIMLSSLILYFLLKCSYFSVDQM